MDKKDLAKIDGLINTRKEKIVEVQDLKIEILEEKNKPDIVLDSRGSRNADPKTISRALFECDKLIALATAQIKALEEVKKVCK